MTKLVQSRNRPQRQPCASGYAVTVSRSRNGARGMLSTCEPAACCGKD